MQKLNADQLRLSNPTKEDLERIKRNDIYIILDDVLDTYNIGAIFRLADAVGAKRVYLCKGSETPPNSRIKKASVNTWQWVDWRYFPSTLDAIEDLKKEVPTVTTVAIELYKNSIPYESFDYPLPIALIVGHESDGVSKEVLQVCDVIVQLPMLGVNVSLNVMVSLGIVLYEVLEKNGIHS